MGAARLVFRWAEDSYDFWDPQNKAGAALVKQVWDGSSGARRGASVQSHNL